LPLFCYNLPLILGVVIMADGGFLKVASYKAEDQVGPMGPAVLNWLAFLDALDNQAVPVDIGFDTIYLSSKTLNLLNSLSAIFIAALASSYAVYSVVGAGSKTTTVSLEKQFIKEVLNENLVGALNIFKALTPSQNISEGIFKTTIELFCFTATQENTLKNTEITLEFLEVAKENNYHLPHYELSQNSSCHELVGVPEKIQELVVEGG
jgi:hypothetical protein